MCPAVFTYHAKGNTFFLCSEYFPFPQTFPLGLGDGQFYAWTDGLRRKDWHDYESIQKEAMRSGMAFSVSQSATLLTAVSRLSLKRSLISISSAHSKVCLMGIFIGGQHGTELKHFQTSERRQIINSLYNISGRSGR